MDEKKILSDLLDVENEIEEIEKSKSELLTRRSELIKKKVSLRSLYIRCAFDGRVASHEVDKKVNGVSIPLTNRVVATIQQSDRVWTLKEVQQAFSDDSGKRVGDILRYLVQKKRIKRAGRGKFCRVPMEEWSWIMSPDPLFLDWLKGHDESMYIEMLRHVEHMDYQPDLSYFCDRVPRYLHDDMRKAFTIWLNTQERVYTVHITGINADVAPALFLTKPITGMGLAFGSDIYLVGEATCYKNGRYWSGEYWIDCTLDSNIGGGTSAAVPAESERSSR